MNIPVGWIVAAALAMAFLGTAWDLDRTSTALSSVQYEVEGLKQAAVVTGELLAATAELDAQHTKELQDVKDHNGQLQLAVAAGDKRLSVPVKCPATARAAGVDNETVRAELDPAAGSRIIGITSDGDEAIVALTALQDYVTRVCLKGRSN